MCTPPKNGGKSCEGEAILKRSCNTQPCPETTNQTASATLKPIIKVIPFSNRPQRYTKCVIKEGDLLMSNSPKIPQLSNNPMISKDLQIPVRAVINNRTLTLFTGVEYETHIMTFNLRDTEFFRIKNKTNCFNLKNKDNTVDLCPFGCENSNKAVDEWDNDFNLFKIQCNNKADIIDVDVNYDKKLKDMMVMLNKLG
jgi:hypothetical protein